MATHSLLLSSSSSSPRRILTRNIGLAIFIFQFFANAYCNYMGTTLLVLFAYSLLFAVVTWVADDLPKPCAENTFGDITSKVVADFGCGCGTLGIASALLDAEYVIGIDIDSMSLETALSNAEDLEVDIDLVQCNIQYLEWRGPVVNTVVMNPPFGTRRKGADLDFLFKALKVASDAVYSFHKTATREHIKRTALRDFNATSAEVLCELRFDVPQLYKFHKRKEIDIAVDLWRFTP